MITRLPGPPAPQRASCPAHRPAKATPRRDTAMNARQMAMMAEATRLTRQGLLLEATALIQQTLASPVVTNWTPDAPCDEEETGITPGRHPGLPSTLRAQEGTQLREAPSGWLP